MVMLLATMKKETRLEKMLGLRLLGPMLAIETAKRRTEIALGIVWESMRMGLGKEMKLVKIMKGKMLGILLD